MIELRSTYKPEEPLNVTDLRQHKREIDNKNEQYSFSPIVPKLPSFTNKKNKYKDFEINLYQLTCTCPQFEINKLKNYSKRDVRKLCIHLYYKLKDISAKTYISNLTALLVESVVKYEAQYFYKYIFEPKQNIVYFSFSEKTDWVNVFVNFKDNNNPHYVLMSFNPVQNRWSYNTAPDEASRIEYIIEKIIIHQLPYIHSKIKLRK